MCWPRITRLWKTTISKWEASVCNTRLKYLLMGHETTNCKGLGELATADADGQCEWDEPVI